MKGISTPFCDWLKGRLVALSEGSLSSELVYDERDTDLGSSIKRAVNSKLGCCVVMSAPSLSQADGSTAEDTRYRITVECAILHNAALSPDFDSVTLAEHFFRALAAAHFDQPDIFPANVTADRLTHTLNGTKWLHQFTINYTTLI